MLLLPLFLSSPFPPPQLSLYFLRNLRFKRLRSSKKASVNNFFSLMLTHNLGIKYCHVVLKWKYWFSCWFREYVTVDWTNRSKTTSMFPLALIELQIDFFPEYGPLTSPFLPNLLYKTCNCQFFLSSFEVCVSFVHTLVSFTTQEMFSQGHGNLPFEMYISKNTALLSFSLCGRLRA